METKWRLMKSNDLDAVYEIANHCHPNFFEERNVLAQKQILSPSTCFILQHQTAIKGYILAHPWQKYHIPPLNEIIKQQPLLRDCFYLHDIAIMPTIRGKGAAKKGLDLLYQEVIKQQIFTITLIAVNFSQQFWSQQGFDKQEVSDAQMRAKLLSYGKDAVYMAKTFRNCNFNVKY